MVILKLLSILLTLNSCAILKDAIKHVNENAKKENPPKSEEKIPHQEPLKPSTLKTKLPACFKKIHNRGVPSERVVDDLIKVIKSTPSSVFAVNPHFDIYSSVYKELGPWRGEKHRRAVMANVLLVMSGYESSWNYQRGRDMSADNTSLLTQEAGILQTSCNAQNLPPISKELKEFTLKTCGKNDCQTFITCTKASPWMAYGFVARLIRARLDHHGPLKRKEIHPWLSRQCVAEIESVL
jgi:hypothetical protein